MDRQNEDAKLDLEPAAVSVPDDDLTGIVGGRADFYAPSTRTWKCPECKQKTTFSRFTGDLWRCGNPKCEKVSSSKLLEIHNSF